MISNLSNESQEYLYLQIKPSKVMSASEVTQSCPTLSDAMDCSLPGSSVHGIFQARILEWVAIAFSEITYKFYLKKILKWLSSTFRCSKVTF